MNGERADGRTDERTSGQRMNKLSKEEVKTKIRIEGMDECKKWAKE